MSSPNSSRIAFRHRSVPAPRDARIDHDLSPDPRPLATTPSHDSRDHFERGIARPRIDCPRCGLLIRLEGMHVELPDEVGRNGTPDIPLDIDGEGFDYRAVIQDVERRILGQALDANDGVMKYAARSLRLKYTTFVAKAHRLGLIAGELG